MFAVGGDTYLVVEMQNYKEFAAPLCRKKLKYFDRNQDFVI